ncbi:hypothetical protein SH449x_003561 [Pirellulaceae bacterium SH449]
MMQSNRVTREQAIAAAMAIMAKHAFAHGTCLAAREIADCTIPTWEIEFAYDGLTGPSSTTDPPTIELQISINDEDVRFLDPWYNRKLEE